MAALLFRAGQGEKFVHALIRFWHTFRTARGAEFACLSDRIRRDHRPL